MSSHGNSGKIALAAALAGVLLTATPPARGALPEGYRKLWSDPALVRRIDAGIEKHRKQDAAITLRTADGKPAAATKLEIVQTKHEFLFGCNAFVLGQLDTPAKNEKYEQAFVRLFNFATVPFYWEGTEPTQGELRYSEGGRDIWRRPPPDRFLPFAKKYDVTLKGHPLLWHAYNPPWLPKDAAQLKQLYLKRFAEIGSRYAAQIPIWDVVNESLVCKPTYPLFTPERDYVLWAFQHAWPNFRPQNTLMINEVTEASHRPLDVNKYYPQVQQLQQQGANIKGIGFQFHFFSGKAFERYLKEPTYAPAALLDVYDRFADFKLPLYITEITIPTAGDAGPADQAEAVADIYRLWFSAANMAGITWWNLGDGTAVKGENTALGGLVDDNFDPKPSYRALDRLINQEWKTRVAATTDAQGGVKFRGFCGKYTVKVTAGGKTQQFEIALSKDQPGEYQLTLRP